MLKKVGILKQKRFFSLTVTAMLLLSSLFIDISIQTPNASAVVTHTIGNVELNQLQDWGRIMKYIRWNGIRQTVNDGAEGGYGYIGLVLDHDGYDHTPGAENIADSFKSWKYTSQDDFKTQVAQGFIVLPNASIQKSFGSSQNKGILTGDPDDILINQTAWTFENKDWAIIQWSLYNLKGVDITNLKIGLEMPLSYTGKYGIGGDGGDDIDGFDGMNNIYWAQDDGGTTMGLSSAITSEPITHYYCEDGSAFASFDDYKVAYEDETWLYNRITAPNQTVGTTPGNRISTVGWDGITLGVGSVKTFTLVIAFGDSTGNMNAAVQEAQFYYDNVISGFLITEFNDMDTGTQQIEVYNDGKGPTDLYAAGYRLSLDGGTTFLTGDNWDKNPLPTHEYAVYTVTGDNIGPEGDTIQLYRDKGGGNYVLIDSVSYGQEGTAPDPVGGESVARRYDTSMVAYTDEWLRNASSGTTWNSQNNVGNINPLPNIVLNRVEYYPWDTAEAYVELMYRFGFGGISGFKVVCDDAVVIPTGTLSATNKYYVLNQSDYPTLFSNMDTSDNVYLYDSNDNLLDMVGWNTPHDQGTYMSRSPDGGGNFTGFNDATSTYHGWVFNQQPSLKITEFYADSSSATIELYNPRGGDIVPNPTRWSLDVTGGTLTGSWAPISIPGNGGYSTFTMSAGSPGEEGDTISLNYDPGSGWILMDEVSYGTDGVAPDPLFGESTARYWNNAGSQYSNDWTRNASTGPTWNAQNDVALINQTPRIIMNEVMFNPSTVPDGRYIVLINIGGVNVNVTGYYLVCDDYMKIPGPQTWLPPFTMWILRYTDIPQLQPVCDSMDTSGDNVYLYDDNGELLDMVGWNNPHKQGMSVHRVPDGVGTYQGHDDITSEAAGWVFDSPLQVSITEISDNESSVAQFEIYNYWYPPIDLSVGFTFNSSSYGGELAGNWMISTVNTGGFAVFNLSTPNGLDPDGDTISFYQNGVLREEISYGSNGVVPDPLPNESVQRFNGSAYSTNFWGRNISTGPNFGAENDIPIPNLNERLMLNEIMFNPSIPGNGFVELISNSSRVLNLTGYRIVGDIEYIIPDQTVVTPNDPYFYLTQPSDPAFFAALSSSRDNVYLYDNNGALVDMAGWSSSHIVDKTMSRIPEGNGTRDGYDDVSSVAAGWQFGQAPTILLIYVYPDRVIYGDRGENITYTLTIVNKHGSDDVVNINNISNPGGWNVTILDEFGNPLTDSTGDGLPDILVLSGGQVNITVIVEIPLNINSGFIEVTEIEVRSTINTLFGDFATLTTRVAPFIMHNKSVSPAEINLLGTGFGEETTITLSVSGTGHPIEGVASNSADIVFVVDDTGSMGGVINDIKQRILEITQVFEAEITSVRFGLVSFKDEPDVHWDQVLTFDVVAFIAAVNNLVAIFGDDEPEAVAEALQLAVDADWRPGNISKIIILIGDNHDHDPYSPSLVAAAAYQGQWGIFTSAIACDLHPPWMPDTFISIAENGSGVFAFYNGMDPEDLAEAIIEAVLTFVPLINISAKDEDVTDGNPMIQDVLPDYIHYIPGSASIPPDVVYIDENNNTILEWNVSEIVIGEMWTVSFNVTSSDIGPQLANVVSESRINYTNWRNSTETLYFPECWINVLPPYPMPPELYIDIQPNKNDIYLYWDEPIFPGTDHYLIYRSSDPRNFDFSTPWINTSTNYDNGTIPLRTSWNHTGAADILHGNYSEQWYYCIRSVNGVGETSYSSRTVGQWTKEFTQQGVATFSLPLEPLETMNTSVDYYLNDMGADYIKWMDPLNHIWMKHGDGEFNDTLLEVGKGYEVKFSSPTKYTFMGLPGAMIRYNSRSYLGFDSNFDAKSLSAAPPDPMTGDVTLTWSNPGLGTVNYHVYYSTTRDGFHKTRGVDYHQLAILPVGVEWFVHFGAAQPNTQYYYMIIPVNATGAEGATTYSIGVWTTGYLAQYDTIGIPLHLSSGDQTADWYCDNIVDTVGINFFMLNQQRWSWHSTRINAGAFDPVLVMTEGYQISTSNATKYTFIGV